MFCSCLSYKEEMPVHGVSEAVDTVESLFLLVTCDSGQEHNYELKVCLRCAVSLCQVHRDLCPRFVDLIGTRLMGTSGWHSPFFICPVLTNSLPHPTNS